MGAGCEGLLIEGYSLTETSPVAVGNPLGSARRPGAIGVPFPSTEIRVVDPENLRWTGLPVSGASCSSRARVFSGYWQRPDETRAALSDDGWFRTGDIVEVDPDGFVSIVDRIKEIITGGFNVMPSEVEAALREHADVSAAVVGGRADGSEDVVAAVVARSHARCRRCQRCRSCLAAYKVPRRVVAVDTAASQRNQMIYIFRVVVGKVLTACLGAHRHLTGPYYAGLILKRENWALDRVSSMLTSPPRPSETGHSTLRWRASRRRPLAMRVSLCS